MLQIKGLTITHRKDLRVILKDFQMTLRPGDKAVIIGEEGNGKSTLLRWIFDPELIEAYAEASGERIAAGERLGYLPQELPMEEREKTVYEFFSAVPEFWEESPRELARLAGELSVPRDFFYREQRMETLSGGEKVKAQMARLLLGHPTVLLLDEPSNDIDIQTLAWLERLINGTEQTVLFISHDETLIERTANVVIHLEQWKRKTECRASVARMSYREYQKDRDARLANQEQQAVLERRQERLRREKLRRIEQKVAHDQERITRQDPHGGYLLKKKMHAVKALEHRYEREAGEMTERPDTEDAIFFKLGGESAALPAGKRVLEFSLERLCVPEGRVLAEHIFLRIMGPEKVCIIGENGAGKTTLLRRIAEELQARRDLKAVYMPQNYEELLDLHVTPVEYLAPSGDREETTRVRTYLGSLKYTADEMEHPIRELSGGQKAKVLLLAMSLSDANVLILDEPTRNFSPLSGPVIRRMLRAFPGAILSISHDRKYIREVCTRVLRLTREGLLEVPAEEIDAEA